MSPEQARTLGTFIREHRTALGLSTRALAARCGVDMATIVRLEQGAFVEPRPDTLRAVAEALGVGVAGVFAKADYAVPSDRVRALPAQQAPRPSARGDHELERSPPSRSPKQPRHDPGKRRPEAREGREEMNCNARTA